MKNNSLTIVMVLVLLILNSFNLNVLAENNKIKVTSLKANQAPVAQKLSGYHIGLNKKEIARFYPDKAILFMYMDLNNDNIQRIENIVNYFSDPDKEVVVKNIQKPKDLSEGFQIFKNLTTIFGPELSAGIIAPPVDKKEPVWMVVSKIKPDNFSAGAINALIEKQYTFTTQNYNEITIEIGKKNNEILAYCVYNNYLLMSNSVEGIEESIDNYKLSDTSILTEPNALKAFSYLPENSLVSILINNSKLAEYAPESKNFKKITKNDNLKFDKTDNSFKYLETSFSKSEESEKIIKPDELKETYDQEEPTKTEKKHENINYFDSYIKAFMQEKNYSATAIILNEQSLEIKTFTPYNMDLFDKINPKLRKEIENILNNNNTYNVASSLPSETIGYILVSNLAGLGYIATTIEEPNIKKMISTGRLMIASVTGMDLEKDLLPILSGHTTVAATEFKKETEPVLLISFRPETIEVFNKLLSMAEKLNCPVKVENKKIKGEEVKILTENSMPFPIAYAKINDSIAFGKFDVVKNLINIARNPNKLLVQSSNFKNFDPLMNESTNLSVYINFDKFADVLENHSVANIPDNARDLLDAFYLSFSNEKDNIFVMSMLVKFKQLKSNK